MSRPTVLSISSQVAYGHVGNSAAIIALQTQGCDAIDIPTVILSSHPGHGASAAIEISANKINEIINSLVDHGRLDKIDAIISGYLRSPQQVDCVKRVVELIKTRNPSAIFCCDPIIGDDNPGLYVPQAVANAIKSELVPISDIITPNLFEFQFLVGQQNMDTAQCIIAARKNINAHVLITSAPMENSSTYGNLLITGGDAWVCSHPCLKKVPNGTGDLFTGLFIGHYVSNGSYPAALSYATGQLNSVLIKSVAEGSDELSLSHLMVATLPDNLPPAQIVQTSP